jgi:L-threonylcarbamoyladenylate synthase
MGTPLKLTFRGAVAALRRGGAVIFPTETAYGLGADANNVRAVRNVYATKGRGRQPMHVLVADIRMAETFTAISPAERRVIRALMPGALTLVVRLPYDAPLSYKLLSAGTGTIGIRIPDSPIARRLTRELGNPITAPSANPAGGNTPYTIEESLKQFVARRRKPDGYLDVGELPRVRPSTLARIEGEKVFILRRGPITKKEIVKVVKKF